MKTKPMLRNACLALLSLPCVTLAQDPVFGPTVDIDQDAMFSGKIPIRKILESGRQFWTTPFTPADGMGEGEAGPRSAQRAWMYPNNPSFSFLRVNGIDSQSCYECHNSIGSYVEQGSSTATLTRKPTPVGGSAGFNSDAFINPLFPSPPTLLVRNPPHVFGSGYVQELAMEMTEDLQTTVASARVAAARTPGVKTAPYTLRSKGIVFGTYATTCTGAGQFQDDLSGVSTVSSDLIVRPFQWKGIASSLRHFIRDALDFHFSMQAVEKVGHADLDGDGLIDEVSLGNVAAMAAFVGMTRPPIQNPPLGADPQVDLGANLFQGNGDPQNIPAGNRMCATCHEPALPLEHEMFFIEKGVVPTPAETASLPRMPSLVGPQFEGRKLPAMELFERRFNNASSQVQLLFESNLDPDRTAELAKTIVRDSNPSNLSASYYSVNLSPKPNADLPAYVFDRLTYRDAAGRLLVPLFSDLRRHDMGDFLQDSPSLSYCFPGYSSPGQPTDAPMSQQIVVPPRLFLTRPLWGVADTGPWMHDGRARTLLEAIQMHSSNGSEANPIVAIFNKLPSTEQQAIVQFLLSLHLPLQK